jgi:hypothetical protein
MACCALAVYLLMHLLLPFRRLSAFVLGASAADINAPNPTVNWSPYARPGSSGIATAVLPAPPRMRVKRGLAWVLALELGLATAAVSGVSHVWTADALALAPFDPLHGYICGRDEPTNKRELP